MTMSANWIAKLEGEPASELGGKGNGLVRLVAAGLPVPPAFVVTTNAFRAAVGTEVEHAEAALASCAVDDPDFSDCCAAAQQRMYEATADSIVLDAIVAAYDELGGAVAVRSSSTSEDSAEASFAGEHDSYLWVDGSAAVRDKVRLCWASLFTPRAVAYRRKVGTAADAMAVVVQRMADARSAGVLMTLNPVNGDRSVVVVESVWGLGEPLVSGELTPDRFVIDKVTGEVRRREVAQQPWRLIRADGQGATQETLAAPVDAESSLTDEDLAELWRIGRTAERLLGQPADVEFVVEPGEGVRLVQIRPETVWSRKSAAAAPQRSAMQMVLATLTSKKPA